MDTLFSNVTIVTMDEAMHVYFDAYLGVTDGKISYLAREAPKEKTKRLVPGEGMVLMPGLINCHTHLPMSVLRGYADDVELSSWLNDYIFPHEDRLDGRSAKAAALLSIAECVRFGTTSISDMYNFCDEIAEAVAESGIKANIARGATLFGEDFDFETHPACRELVALKEKWDGYDNGRIRVEASVHGEYTSDYRLWDALSEFAINEKVGMHVHLSETKAEHEQCLERNGLTPAQVLDCHHVFDTRAIAAHCVWVTPEDMRLLAKRGVTAVHCPVSNLKLASGICPLKRFYDNGINLAIGTDGPASNNCLDMFREMFLTTGLSKVREMDAAGIPADAILYMATAGGAHAMQIDDCDRLAVGKKADLVMIDLHQPNMQPENNLIKNLVYSGSKQNVKLTMVNGQILYENGEFRIGFDPEEIYARSNAIIRRISGSHADN